MNDICLLLEGTYPYVAGGVSSWVRDIVNMMDDITFSIVYIGPNRNARKKLHYQVPPNILDFREIYLYDYDVSRKARNVNKKDINVLEEFILGLRKGDTTYFKELVSHLREKDISIEDIVYSYGSWEVLEKIYNSEAEDQSFIDYFWTWRFIYLPLFKLLLADIPQARVYHSVSTGYAGVLGALGKILYNRPYILTEHGIYTRERKIDISQADWIYDEDEDEIKINEHGDFFKDWWISLFSFLSKVAYNEADEIITLYEGNRCVQINEGAPEHKTQVIPNGVEFDILASLEKIPRADKLRIGFMGRVVPIKDVKTLILACSIVHNKIPDIEVYIMGPTDEDEEYFDECKLLVEMQKLGGIIKFTGKIDIKEYYPKMDIIVLTSISEGQPIVILEAAACGLPCVATDVGACSELLYGSTPDDKLMGPSGIITPVADPQATADAVITILTDKELYDNMSATAVKRIAKYYSMDKLIAKYKTIYQQYIEEIMWAPDMCQAPQTNIQ